MNIYVNDDEDTKAKLAKAVFLLYRLRKATKHWHEVFGCAAKNERERWENNSDDFLRELMKEGRELEMMEKIKVVEK